MIADLPAIVIDADIFGLSYHTNRQLDWHQQNPGVGLTIGFPQDDVGDLVVSGGTYVDSYDAHARYLMGGFRLIAGDRYAWHADVVVELGYYDGSGNDGLVGLPVLAIGYDRVNLCVTGVISPNRTVDNDPRKSSTSLIAVFAEYELWRF